MRSVIAILFGSSVFLMANAGAFANDGLTPISENCQTCNSCNHDSFGSFCRKWGKCKGGCHKYCFSSTCDMIQHYPYFPKNHGYYYYRPYNHIHVLEHQYQALSLGGDPRAPYLNQMFEKIYDEYAGIDYEENGLGAMQLPTLTRRTSALPDLEAIVKGK